MRRPSRANGRRGKGKPDHYLLRLFMAGNGANSRLALVNLRVLCAEHLKGRFTIEAVDVVKDFTAAIENNILVTPALVLIMPLPRVVILGNLNDHAKVMLALRLTEGDA
jgi:circadian clock protein KaiB